MPAELASHIDIGLRLLHVSEPAREIAPAELTPASFAEFGLDPPASVVTLGAANGPVATVNFGVLNPVGTSQYVRVGGSPTVYLMPRHVGSEWQVAGDMARRLRAQAESAVVAHRGPSLLLPVSMAQIWAVEIVTAGKLTRFERDSAGNLVSAYRPAFAHRRRQCPRRRPGAGSRHRGRARVVRCGRGRDACRPRRRRWSAYESRPRIPAGDRIAVRARQLDRSGARRIRRHQPTASTAMRGLRPTARS